MCDQKVFINLYHALAQSIIGYLSPPGEEQQKNTYCTKLRKRSNSAQIISPGRYSYPTHQLYIQSNVLSVRQLLIYNICSITYSSADTVESIICQFEV